MAGSFPSQRTEIRTSLDILVELYSLDNTAFEFAHTLDVSQHGACVLSKMAWSPQQRLSIRSMHGQLNSRARVVYCELLHERGYAVGLELYQPSDKWPEGAKAFAAKAGT